VAAARRGRGGKANRRGWSATIADMDELRCIFCDQTESQAGRLYKHTPRPVRTPRAPPLICAECSESINFVVRTNLVREGRLFEAEAEFPPIASHRFPLRGPDDEEAEMVVEIGAPYAVNNHTANCPLSIKGPIPIAWHHVPGAGTLQALCLALSSAYNTLEQLDHLGWKWVAPYPDLDILFGRKTARPTE